MWRIVEDSLMWRNVEDEVIVLDKRNWNYMAVNGSGAVLWKELTRGVTSSSLIACLCETYDIDEETASRDVDAFLSMLIFHGLLVKAED